MDINQFSARFDSEDACVKHLAQFRWPDGPVCDKCGVTNRAWKRAEPRSWVRQACKYSFSVTTGTPLHKVKLPL